ncbi:MAG: Nudix family hydrolase [Nitrosomonas sp.]|jgi:8-oxo-dGTP diphosphatase|nr:Nudix family hydrolase [Nitrosomonas sp.]
METLSIVEVAAAVIVKPDGNFLLTCRPEGKPYAGYWEFPGGKVEAGEAPLHALDRELQEELGIQLIKAEPWITRTFTYPHATVRLHFYRITEWYGIPYGRENQLLSWQLPCHIEVKPMLPANTAVLRALMLPPVYAITHAAEIGVDASLRQIRQAFQNGLQLLQIREKTMDESLFLSFSEQVITLARNAGAQVLINTDTTFRHKMNAINADGIHLSSTQLMALTAQPGLECGWRSASCHNAEELYQAEVLGFDFVVLGPVYPTLSHTDTKPLGWQKFAALIRNYSLPVYALGGMSCNDLKTAQEMGAHGIAIMRRITEL